MRLNQHIRITESNKRTSRIYLDAQPRILKPEMATLAERNIFHRLRHDREVLGDDRDVPVSWLVLISVARGFALAHTRRKPQHLLIISVLGEYSRHTP